MGWLQAAVMGLVEGITEFLPISSTGHLILAGELLDFERTIGGEQAAKAFDIFIQLGAILAVVVAYPRRFGRLANLAADGGFAGWRGLALLVLTTLPGALLAVALQKQIKEHLFSSLSVAIGAAVGAVWILAVERWRPRVRREGLDALTWRDALAVGLFQCFALWPGMSRAGATILGGMMVGIDRRTATEYSFFAAVPLLCGAAVYELAKNYRDLQGAQLTLFAVGLVASFVFAFLAVKWLLHFVGTHTLRPFAWYRLALAAAVLCWWWWR